MLRSRATRAIAAILFAAFFMAVGAGVALAVNQPHMVNARNLLYSARSELYQATYNKGGYRQNAINDINAAINNVNNGIHYANMNSR